MNLAFRLKLFFLVCFIFAADLSVLLAKPDSCTISLETQISHVSCNGITDGAIELFFHENGNHAISWEDGVTSIIRENLSPGSYPVTIHTSNCSMDTFFVVEEPKNPLEILVEESSNVSCYGTQDGFVRVSAVGGTSPYEFSFADNKGFSSTDIFSNLNPGEYLFYAKDMNGCEASLLVNISQPDEIFIDIGTEAEISSGEILELNAGDGYSEYLWSTGEISQKINYTKEVDVLTTETISVEAMDGNNCWGKSSPLKVIIHTVKEKIEEVVLEEMQVEQNQIPD